jgi:serine/threonine protein kinase
LYPVSDANNKSEPPDVASYVPRTLRTEFKSRRALPAAEVVALGLKLTSALAHLHAHGLVHRDVKPSNILFIGGEPKLADAGLVAAMDDARSLVGTTGYIAPEGPGTPQADLYALGKVLYEAVFQKDRQEFPALPSDLASRCDHARLLELNAVFLKACATRQEDRYQSAKDMQSDLQLLNAGRSVKHRHALRQGLRQTRKVVILASIPALAVALIFSRYSGARPKGRVLLSGVPAANQEYNSGVIVLHSGSGDFVKAKKHFQRAIELDPKFAAAYARLSLAYISSGAPASNTELLRKAQAAARKAIEIDWYLPDGHSCLASTIDLLDFDWERAEKELLIAYKLNPNSEDVLYQYANNLVPLGQAETALHLVEKAQRLESRSADRLQNAGWIYLAARKYDKAIAKLDEVLAVQPANPQRIDGLRIPAYCGAGDYKKAIQVEREAALLNGGDPTEVNEQFDKLQRALQTKGPSGYWQQKLQWAKEQGEGPITLASLYARVGNKPNAMEKLEEALKLVPHELYFRINTDPAFDILHSDPAFLKITENLKMPKRVKVP